MNAHALQGKHHAAQGSGEPASHRESLIALTSIGDTASTIFRRNRAAYSIDAREAREMS